MSYEKKKRERSFPEILQTRLILWHQNFSIMDACEAYARRWAKEENVELDSLSEWIRLIGNVLKRNIRRFKHSVNIRSESNYCDTDVFREPSRLHEILS